MKGESSNNRLQFYRVLISFRFVSAPFLVNAFKNNRGAVVEHRTWVCGPTEPPLTRVRPIEHFFLSPQDWLLTYKHAANI